MSSAAINLVHDDVTLYRWMKQKGIDPQDDDVLPYLDRVAANELPPSVAAMYISLSLQGLHGNVLVLDAILSLTRRDK